MESGDALLNVVANPTFTRNRRQQAMECHGVAGGAPASRSRARVTISGVSSSLGREFGQQPLVAGKVIEHPEQEVRLARGVPQRLRFDPGERQEAAEPFRVFRQEAQGLNRQRFGPIPASSRGVLPSMNLGVCPVTKV